MGIIKAISSAVGGGFADQWLEVIEPDRMSDTTVFTAGVPVRRDDKRGSNRKGTENTVSDGSVIHVYPNQFMLLVDGGKIVDYTAEEGYYTVKTLPCRPCSTASSEIRSKRRSAGSSTAASRLSRSASSM